MSNKEFSRKIGPAIEKAKAYLLSKYEINQSDLDDVLQEASLKALKAIKSFQRKSSFDSWFIAICKNEAYALFRRNKKQQAFISRDDNDAYIKEVCAEDSDIHDHNLEEKAWIINQALDKLSGKHKEIIRIALKGCSSSQEMADILKIPVSSARTRLHYAKKRLKKLIQIHAYEPNI